MKLINPDEAVIGKYYLCYEIFSDTMNSITIGELKYSKGEDLKGCFVKPILIGNCYYHTKYGDWNIYSYNLNKHYNFPQFLFELNKEDILFHIVTDNI